MTKEQLRARPGMVEMLNSDNFAVLLAFFAEGCPYVGVEAVDKVNNEGRFQGWFFLLACMRGIRKEEPKKEAPKAGGPLYAEPSLKSDQNKP